MTNPRQARVLLLDVDGTLVNYRAELPAGAAAAIREARTRGHRVYLCTGRSRAEIYDHLWELGVDGLIGGNGSYVEDAGRAIFHQVLDPAVVAEAVEWMLAEELGFYLECNSGLFGSDDLPEKAAAWLDGGVTPENVAFFKDALPNLIYGTRSGRDDVNKISFVLRPGLDLDALATRYAGRAAIDSWSMTGKRPEFGEIGQLGVHKGVAIERLVGHLGVPTDHLIGFGDARSDLGMFAACGMAVAMGNAPDEVKAAASLVTDHVDAGGLANAFRRLGLIG